MLIGRTKNSGKGAFAFNVESQGKAFATHMQHSEEPQFPTIEEVNARKMQMDLILKKITETTNRCVILTGDLNLDDQEYKSSNWKHFFYKEDEYKQKCCFRKGNQFQIPQRTWGGDGFYADFRGKNILGPLNLDHTMLLKGSACSIHTSLVNTEFDCKKFKKEALSDHAGLFSQIHLSPSKR
ncbi:MAG: hypothetical protein K2Y01_01725 [Rhabdochlamydiaceae bacterium]|nr:hypothetical protein [Rhabdochlamydiaceae bacterium]